MFVGYQMNNGVLEPHFLKETREELENLPCVTLDAIEEHDFAVMYNGKVFLDAEELKVAKQESVRSVRNHYLEEYVDAVVSNPLRWNDLSEEEKAVYTNYRRYLLDYTDDENWWEANPLTLEEWKQK